MQVNLKRMFIVSLVVLYIMCGVVSCSNKKKVDYSPSISNKLFEFDKLIDSIQLSKTKDGGYSFMLEEAREFSVLYDTFYAIEIEKLICGNDNINAPKNMQHPVINFKSSQNLSVSDLYYYCNIFKKQIKSNKPLIEDIKKYTLKLQTNTGTFAINEDLFNQIGHDYVKSKELYLSTFYGVTVLDVVGARYDKSKVINWVRESIAKQKNLSSNTFTDKMTLLGNYRLLLYTAKILDQDLYKVLISQYKEEIISEIIKTEEEIKIEIVSGDVYLNSMLIYLDLSELLNYDVQISNDSILSFIIQHQSDEGGFRLSHESQINALPTYIAVYIMKKIGKEQLVSDDVSTFLKKYKLNSGYYVSIIERESNIVYTYYAYNILKFLGVDERESIKRYIASVDENTKMDLLYWKLKAEIDINMINKEDKKIVNKLFTDLVNNYSLESTVAEKKDLLLAIELLNELDIKIEKQIQKKIISKSQNYKNSIVNKNSSKGEGSLKKVYDVMILNSLQYKISLNRKEIVKMINESINEGFDELYLVFPLLYCEKMLRPDECFTYSEYSFIEEILQNTYCGKGVFSYSSEKDSYNFVSTYKALWILKEVFNIELSIG